MGIDTFTPGMSSSANIRMQTRRYTRQWQFSDTAEYYEILPVKYDQTIVSVSVILLVVLFMNWSVQLFYSHKKTMDFSRVLQLFEKKKLPVDGDIAVDDKSVAISEGDDSLDQKNQLMALRKRGKTTADQGKMETPTREGTNHRKDKSTNVKKLDNDDNDDEDSSYMRKKKKKLMKKPQPKPEPILDGSDIVPYFSYNALFFSAVDEDIQYNNWKNYFAKKLFYYHRWLS